MLEAERRGRIESGELMSKRSEGTANAIIFRVIRRFLDGVTPKNGGFAVGRVGLVGCEIDFSEESAVAQ